MLNYIVNPCETIETALISCNLSLFLAHDSCRFEFDGKMSRIFSDALVLFFEAMSFLVRITEARVTVALSCRTERTRFEPLVSPRSTPF